MRLRIGVVGLGRISQLMHLPNLRDLSDRFELAGVCDLSPGVARLMAARYGAQLATSDHRELLSAGLDAVLVAVPVGLRHFEEVVELYGDEQTVSLSFPTPFLEHAPTAVVRRRGDGARTVEEHWVASYEEAFVRELEHFHDCVATGRQPDPPAARPPTTRT